MLTNYSTTSDYIPSGYSYSVQEQGTIQDCFNVAAAICSGETMEDPDMVLNAIQRVNSFASLLKKMDNDDQRPAAIVLCDRLVQELNLHYPAGPSKIAKWITLNTNISGNGAYPPFNNFFQTIADLKGKPRLFGSVFDKSEEALKLLTLRLIDFAAYKPTALFQMDDFMNLVLSDDLKGEGNLFLTCKKYLEMSKQERINVTSLGIKSITDLINFLGKDGCSKVKRLVSIPVDFIFSEYENKNIELGHDFSIWQAKEEITNKIASHFPNLAYMSFQTPKESDAFYKVNTLHIKNFPCDMNFRFLQKLPHLSYLYITDCQKITDFQSLEFLNVKVLKIFGAAKFIKFDFLLTLPLLHSIWVSVNTTIPDEIRMRLSDRTIVAYAMGQFNAYSLSARDEPKLLLT